MDGYEDLGLRGGVWRGQITRARPPGRILLVHMAEVLAEAEVTPRGDGAWQVSVGLSADRLTDGAATFALHEDAGAPGEPLQPGSTILATLPLIAGKALHRDLRAELTLLRAELDLLKREFRRHAAEGGGASIATEASLGAAGARRGDEASPTDQPAVAPRQGEAPPVARDALPAPALDLPLETGRPEPA